MKRTSVPAHKGNYHAGRTGGIRVIVIHTGETGEGSTAAEGMGNWFADARARASAHKGADTDSICTYLPDTATAWAAPGANADGLQLELLGLRDEGVGEGAVGDVHDDVVDRDTVETVHDVEADDVRVNGSQGHREGAEAARSVGQHDAEEIRHDAHCAAPPRPD